MTTPEVIPYEFRPAKFMHPNLKGYWVTLHCLFDGTNMNWFAHAHDSFENQMLAHECGAFIESFTHHILVTPERYTDIFNEIEDYVRRSSLYRESFLQESD